MIKVRRGNLGDIAQTVKLRMDFLNEISHTNQSDSAQLEQATFDFLKNRINNGFLFWVAEDDGSIIGTSGLIFVQRPPTGDNLSGIEGYIMNIYTCPEYRRKGIATLILNEIIEYLKKMGIKKVRLNATDDGRPLYKRLGFKDNQSQMELCL